jgi:predicted Zn-dependent protease
MVEKILLKTSILLALAQVMGLSTLIGCGPASALFFGVDQQAETSKHQGDYAYETQNYPAAINYYSQAISTLPSDADQALSGLYWCRALSNDVAGNYERASADWLHSKQCDDQLIAAAKLNPQQGINTAWPQANSDQLGLLIKWRATCDPTTADYFSNVNVRRWPATRTPIRVCVDESSTSGFGAGSRETVMQAVNQWVSAEPRLRVAEVDDPNQADIVYARPNAAIGGGAGGRTTFEESTDARGNRWLTKVNVKLTAATVDFDQMNSAQRNQLYNLALHESGHAFGIDGHSPSGLDVMYWKSPLLRLSERDISTIRRIYQ